MKNQYFGDFGDYQKFSLLKTLRDEGNFKITVHWMKTADDGGSDGKHVTYLKDIESWQKFDKDIFDFIRKHISNKRRDLSLYEKSTHALGIQFLNDHIEDLGARNKLLDKIREDKKSDLIFFDPDNGIEVKSISVKSLHKYVTWEDIRVAFESGKSVLIYQHFSRKNRDIFIQEKLAGFETRLNAKVFVIKVKYSVYFLLLQKVHKDRAQKSLKEYSKIWGSLALIR
jgi:hypothetical protein